MSTKEEILNAIEQVPEASLEAVLEFVRLLKTRNMRDKLDISVASESSLKKDWLRNEDDEAWRDL
ncbi:DUF2281 domain-containing protein [bacterium]|nr:MAG: DUF2281 domain-containing protein [bacterium]